MRAVTKTRKRIIIGAITGSIAAVLITLGVIWYTVAKNTTLIHSATEPTFQAVLPENKAIDNLGGWQKLASPGGDVSYVFTDTVDNVSLRVSQQPLPKALKTDTAAKLRELAESDNARRMLDADGVKLYVGTSAQGPQSVYLVKNGLLILIKSSETLPDALWVSYVTSLQ